MTGREAEAGGKRQREQLWAASQVAAGQSWARDGIPDSLLTLLSESQNVPKTPAEASRVELG